MTSTDVGGFPVAARPGTGAAILERLTTTVSTDALVGIALAIVWALGHGFTGIEGDARIYMGRALADLDPLGVGRDMLFTLDGQSSFTLFRSLARTCVATFGLGPSVIVLSLLNMAVWFTAIVVFVRAIVPGRAAALVLAIVFVLPRLYTPWNLLAAGEMIPVPRPLAEAGVLFAMGALCQGRSWACVAWLAGAALLHPIMAAPGFGVLLVCLGIRDKRWFVLAASIGAMVVAAAVFGFPLASRLLVKIDPQWLAILRERVDYVFPTLWPIDAIGPPIVRIATILVALRWLDRRTRLVFGATIGVGLVGVLGSILLGDGLADLLFIQAQPWRALWLLAALAPVAAGICVWRLPAQGAGGRIALASLASAWLALDWYPVAPLAACLALVPAYMAPRFVVGRTIVRLVYVLCATLAALALWSPILALTSIAHSLPAGTPLQWSMIWAFRLPALPIAALALLWWRWPDAAATRIGAGACVAIGFLALATLWNGRSPARADEDAGNRKQDLAAILEARPGAILWTESDDPWFWLGRPNWNSATQGSAIVFSRDLALLWHQRALTLVEDGLASGGLLHPRAIAQFPERTGASRQDLSRFCAMADAPAWIVTAMDPDDSPLDGMGVRIWTAPIAQTTLAISGDAIRWRHVERYTLIPCAKAPP